MNWLKFIIYLMFLGIFSIGIGSLYKTFELGLVIFGVGGLLYIFCSSIVNYLDNDNKN